MRVLNVHAVDPELVKQIFRQVRLLFVHLIAERTGVVGPSGRCSDQRPSA